MQSRFNNRLNESKSGAPARCAFLLILAGVIIPGLCFMPAPVLAQTAAPATNHFLGTITAVAAGSLTVKTDAGVERKVTVPEGIALQRVAPGARTLANAATIQFSELAVGDRVLVRIAPEPATDPVTAISIVAIPQADLAQKQEKDREEWQRNGVGGLVKSVDPGTGVIVITSGAGAMLKTTTVHTTPATVLRRYAPNSVSFDQATAAPLEVIKVGDQVRARGTKNADGTELTADEVVSGSFRNISGVIGSIDRAAMTLTLKDLATKQTVTVHVGPDAQMRKLPDTMAKRLAALTTSAGKPGERAGGQSAGGSPAGGRPAGGAPAGGAPAANGAEGNGRPAYGDVAGGRSGGGDLQQMISRAPAIHLSDLQKGDAVMLVSTQGTGEVTAVTLLAGVEPLLEAPASTQNMLLSNWSMSSGSAEAAQ
jgi:hypothetical protein